MSGIWLINPDFSWSVFNKNLFHQQILSFQKWECFAIVCPFWWQIGKDILCLSSVHSYFLSCVKAMLKSMLCLVHSQDLNLHFAVSWGSFPFACIICKAATLGFFSLVEKVVVSFMKGVISTPLDLQKSGLVFLQPNCLHGWLGSKKWSLAKKIEGFHKSDPLNCMKSRQVLVTSSRSGGELIFADETLAWQLGSPCRHRCSVWISSKTDAIGSLFALCSFMPCQFCSLWW